MDLYFEGHKSQKESIEKTYFKSTSLGFEDIVRGKNSERGSLRFSLIWPSKMGLEKYSQPRHKSAEEPMEKLDKKERF